MDPNHTTKSDSDNESKINDSSSIDKLSDEEEQFEQDKNDNDNSDISSKNSGGKNNNGDTMLDDSEHDKDQQDDDEESTSHDESVDESSDNENQDDCDENDTSSSDGENVEPDEITNNNNNGSNDVNNEDKQKPTGEIYQNSNKNDSNLNNYNHKSSSMATKAEKYDKQQVQSQTSHQPFQHTSIEALLSVPLDFIFRKTNQETSLASTSKSTSVPVTSTTTPSSKKRKHNQHQHTNHNQQQQFLLSKTEAMTFIQITNLANELDCLIQMATNAIYKSHMTKQSSIQLTKLKTSTSYYHNLLRPIHVLLKIHGEKIPNQILDYVQCQMERILLIEFPSICQVLHQCSEQNWSVSNALVMSTTQQQQQQQQNTVYRLGKEKGILAEIEEELCNRMNGLIQMTMDGTNSFSSNGHHHNGDSDTNVDNQDIFDRLTKTINNKGNKSSNENDDESSFEHNEEFISMAKLCQKLLNERKEEVNNTDDGEDQNDNDELENNEVINGNSELVGNDITSSQLFAVDALSKLSSWGR